MGILGYSWSKGEICRNQEDDLSGKNAKISYIDSEVLKCEYQKGFVTPVVHTLTYVY